MHQIFLAAYPKACSSVLRVPLVKFEIAMRNSMTVTACQIILTAAESDRTPRLGGRGRKFRLELPILDQLALAVGELRRLLQATAPGSPAGGRKDLRYITCALNVH
jgi:hypothetical protein